MLQMSRRHLFLSAAGAAAAFGLSRRVTFIDAALAQKAPDAGKGFKHYKIGDIQMTSLYDVSSTARMRRASSRMHPSTMSARP